MEKILNYINGELVEPTSGNYLDNYKKIDVGLNLGLGYNLKEVFLIEVIYGYGFSKVHNAWVEDSKMDNQTASNRSLQLSLGYVIGSKQ